MNAPKNRLTTPKTTIIKLFIEPGSRLPLHKPNPIPHKPTAVNTKMSILSFFGWTYLSFNKQTRVWKLLNYVYLNILVRPYRAGLTSGISLKCKKKLLTFSRK